MARDDGLEGLINGELAGIDGVTQQPMFGGWAWMLNGNLLCACRVGRMLVRVGKPKEEWAFAIAGVSPMLSRGRPMAGWVWANDAAFGSDAVRGKLVKAALAFNRTLPAK